jgi:starch synthase
MKILLVSSEVVPFAKTGGLADVAGALPKALKESGHDIRVILPRYKMVDINKFGLKLVLQKIEIIVGSDIEAANIYETKIPNTEVIVYFVDNPKFFDRDGLYQINGVDYADNCERFTFFCKAVLEFIKKINWKPDVLHANDWQSALTVGYLKTILKGSDFYGDIGTLYSIHNMAYQGNFEKQKIHVLGLPWTFFTYETLEFFGELSLTKAGFVFADIINTVSAGYAKEIQTKEFGCGMDGLLRYRSRDVYGVLNGIDYDVWDPEADKKIKKTYTPVRLAGKKECKRDLQKSCGLPEDENVVVLGLVTRLADQKGLDLFVAIMEDLMHRDLQIVILGTGDLMRFWPRKSMRAAICF